MHQVCVVCYLLGRFEGIRLDGLESNGKPLGGENLGRNVGCLVLYENENPQRIRSHVFETGSKVNRCCSADLQLMMAEIKRES